MYLFRGCRPPSLISFCLTGGSHCVELNDIPMEVSGWLSGTVMSVGQRNKDLFHRWKPSPKLISSKEPTSCMAMSVKFTHYKKCEKGWNNVPLASLEEPVIKENGGGIHRRVLQQLFFINSSPSSSFCYLFCFRGKKKTDKIPKRS